MYVTAFLTCTVHLHLTIPTAKVLFVDFFFVIESTSAVDHTTKVWLLAVVALVKSAIVHGKLKKLSLIVVARAGQSFILVKALFFSYIKCNIMNILSKLIQFGKLAFDLFTSRLCDLLFAARAVHEGKVDLKSAPTGLEEHLDAIGVEYMTTAKLDASLRIKIARVAYRAKLI